MLRYPQFAINIHMRNKEWISEEVFTEGECEAIWDGEPWTGRYEVGRRFSGKTKVYEGIVTRLRSPEGRTWEGNDRWCPVEALKQMFRQMSDEGLQMFCAGLDSRFYTTGLSDGSGYGYLRGHEDKGPFFVFDTAPDSNSNQS